ncbi:MAG: septal ring lytic transglycosylase RlpA family protein [Leptospirillum sp.]|jgi:rare lipoprotein A
MNLGTAQRLFLFVSLFFFAGCSSIFDTHAHWGYSDTLGIHGGSGTLNDQSFPQVGIASWYGPTFYGKPTASGSIFRKNELTAAHRTLPLGTRVRVQNLKNNKEVDVLINDRGPFVEGRIIDLSWLAAKKIGMLGNGTAPVRITPLNEAAFAQEVQRSNYAIQVGTFTNRKDAEVFMRRLSGYSHREIVTSYYRGGHIYRVRVGLYPTLSLAHVAASKLKKSLGEAFVVKL